MSKKIHIVSLSNWNEPRRIRKQITELLLDNYDVVYHSPSIPYDDKKQTGTNITFRKLPFIRYFASTPIVSILNAIALFFYIKKNVSGNHTLINFIPESMVFLKPNKFKVISIVNDDYSLSVKPIFSRWMYWLIKRMSERSDHTLFVSNPLMEKYKSDNAVLFHPWADKKDVSSIKTDKSIILYWGYICHTLDYEVIEEMASQIASKSLPLEIVLAGPVSENFSEKIRSITASHSCISYHPPTETLEDLEIKRVIFGIEPLRQDYKNGAMVEMPNKGPRFLAHGIPLVYSGCSLMSKPFFVEYNGDIESTTRHISENSESINKSIDEYFRENNSITRLELLTKLIS